MMIAGVVLVWLVVLVKAPAVARRWWDRRLLTYWMAMVFLALCLTFERDAVYLATSTVTGVPNLAHGLSYGAGIIAAYLSQMFALYSYSHERLRREALARTMILTVGLVLYGVFFLVGPARLPTDTAVPHLATTTAGLAAFRVVLAVLVCWSSAEVVWLAWRLSVLRRVERALQVGMRLVALGAALIFVRISVEYAVLPLWAAASGWQQSLSYSGALYALNAVAMVGAMLLAVGTTLPGLVRNRRARQVSAEHRAALATLRPLWEVMRSLTPALSTTPTTIVARGARGRVIGRWGSGQPSPLDGLYRMVAEIRDGWVVLNPYRDAQVEAQLRARAQVRGLDGVDLEAYVEAGSLRHAAAVRSAGAPVATGARATALLGSTFEAELSHLLRVAHWWSREDQAAAAAAGSGTSASPAGTVRVEG